MLGFPERVLWRSLIAVVEMLCFTRKNRRIVLKERSDISTSELTLDSYDGSSSIQMLSCCVDDCGEDCVDDCGIGGVISGD